MVLKAPQVSNLQPGEALSAFQLAHQQLPKGCWEPGQPLLVGLVPKAFRGSHGSPVNTFSPPHSGIVLPCAFARGR